MVTYGNGRSLPTAPIRALNRWRARWVSTMVNSCAAKWCCGVAHVLRQQTTSAPATVIFSTRMRDGNLVVYALPGNFELFNRHGRILDQQPAVMAARRDCQPH